jgi:hypothetical protein
MAPKKTPKKRKTPRAASARSRQPRNSNGQFARTASPVERPRQEYERMRAREGYDEPRRQLTRGEWEDSRRGYSPEYGFDAQHRGGHLPRYENEARGPYGREREADERYGREREPNGWYPQGRERVDRYDPYERYGRYGRDREYDGRYARGYEGQDDRRDDGRGRDERRLMREPEPYNRREREWRARERFDTGRERPVERYEPAFERTERDRRSMREPERWSQTEEWRPREIPSEDEPARRARELQLNDEDQYRRHEIEMNQEPQFTDRDTELNEAWWDEHEARMNEDVEERWNGSPNGRW